MNDETAMTATDTDSKRKLALLKAIGLDKVPPEQRELALNIAKRYDLDLMLKHLVLIEGRPYITRDGLLWVAHRSGQLDGIEVTDPEVVNLPGVGEFWRATCSVYRKDMSRPITYAGRYPTKGGNQRYAPEMAVKVSEVMALRRAFNVSAPVFEERWDHVPEATREATPKASLQDRVSTRLEAVTTQGQGTAEPEWQDEPADQAGVPAAIPTPCTRVALTGANPYRHHHRTRRDPLSPLSPVSSPERCDGFHKEHGACRTRGAAAPPGNHRTC